MIFLDKLTEQSTDFTHLMGDARKLRVHSDVMNLASHLIEDPSKLEGAAPYIFWPAYQTWLEWQTSEGTLGFYFDGGADSVTQGHGLWIAQRNEEPTPLVVPLSYDVSAYKLSPFDAYQALRSHKLITSHIPSHFNDRTMSLKDRISIQSAADSLKPIIWAILALINSPKIIRSREVTNDRINRQRLKRGRFAFHPHHEVMLNVDKMEVMTAAGDGDGTHRALHFVRSHIRFRLGQYELVRPHWRGDPELGILNTSYAAGREGSKFKD